MTVALSVMTVMGVAGRAMGMPANLELMLGTMFGLPAGTNAWLLGFAIHLMNGGIFGLVHALFAGVFMGMMPAMHRSRCRPPAGSWRTWE